LIIRDHINLMGGILGSHRYSSEISPQHGGEIYDRRMSAAAIDAAVAGRFNAYQGTYLATLGPNYETRAEYRMMRRIGADVAGMSTVPEVLAAASMRMRVLGISMVSNVANPDLAIKADHAEVLKAGKAGEVRMESIVRRVLAST
jgi:purine-nucleoside phosphorylase